MAKYIIAVRRDARESAPADLSELLSAVPGLTVEGAGNKQRVQVEASAEAIEHARRLVCEYAYIEPVISHSRQ